MSILDHATEQRITECPSLRWCVYEVSPDGARTPVGIVASERMARRWIALLRTEWPRLVYDIAPAVVLDDDLWARTEEEHEIAGAAVRMVLDTLRTSRATDKYKAYDWLAETVTQQATHAFEHARALLAELCELRDRDGEPHAAHAVCRLALMQALQARKAKLSPQSSVLETGS